MHRVLDVNFDEDASRIRKGLAQENGGVLQSIALSLMPQDECRGSLCQKQKQARWNNAYCEELSTFGLRWPWHLFLICPTTFYYLFFVLVIVTDYYARQEDWPAV